MFGGNDPFASMFGHMQRQMNMMDDFMGSMMDPFGMMGPPRRRAMIDPFNMIQDAPYGGGRQAANPHDRSRHQQQMNPFDPFGMHRGFGGIFETMNQLQHHAMNDPNSHVYSQSTMMTIGPDGRPRVVEQSTRKAGEVKETRRTLRDGEREEMEIGHSIGDRTHVIEKKRDKDGKVRSQQHFANIGEDEAADFDREFQTRAQRRGYGRSGDQRRALDDGYSYNRRAGGGSSTGYRGSGTSASGANAPIITLPDDDEDMNEAPEPRSSGGPIIREISEEEAESSTSKKRRDNTGRSKPTN